MKTNEKQNVKTDWTISDIVKPEHMNSLTRHVPYDYIVTDKMLEGLSGAIDVDMLLNPADPDTGDEGGGMIHGRTGEYHVLINAPVPGNIILEFPASSTGGLAGELNVHVYAFGPYKARVNPGASAPNANITHYFHTAGDENAVILYGLGYNTYVGSFDLPNEIKLGEHHTFRYEKALGSIPGQPQEENATIERKAWMSNAVGGDGGPSALKALKMVSQPLISSNPVTLTIADGYAYRLEMEDSLSAAVTLVTNSEATLHSLVYVKNLGAAHCGTVTLVWRDAALQQHTVALDMTSTSYEYCFDVYVRNVQVENTSYTIASVRDYPVAYRNTLDEFTTDNETTQMVGVWL